ncbi:hypothetical protein CH333_02700 [candidate division WOR-3 bacterium JGI_Cruoil_03_44_89]|uniref:Type IX secretion system protein PorV domain-containing protein n=1 Tax=candidate division WOR-3 bacterium JGI_Cruoil_03_44_89 TaxID=1973748 RepID=A0A235BXA3_UNCW3|nr:MAG: hypothetical protein CH333_02700 [candidate division WOR-3 bacterium JGI_Cruoil_03_44_89]
MKKFFAYLVLLFVPGFLYSQFGVSKVGTTAAQFLKIGVGARAVGMGGAFVAVADDATAIYWNPAGVSRLSKNEAVVIHTSWLAGLRFDFAGVIICTPRWGNIGVGVTSLSMPEMKVRTVENSEGTGEMFAAGDLALGLSYARCLTDRFSVGINLKYINQRIWHMSASTFAVDVGTLFETDFNDMKIGMSILNFGGKIGYSGRDILVYYDFNPDFFGDNDRIIADLHTDRWSLPLMFRVGISLDVIGNESNTLTLAIDAKHPNDNTESIDLGIEYIFHKRISLRAGYSSLFLKDSEGGLTLGGGIRHRFGSYAVKLDVAYADFGRLQNAKRLSLSFEF